jgi:hypothetical protein
MSALPGYITLLDIAKKNGSDQVVGLIDETSRNTPEVRLAASREIKGTSYKTWVRTALPNAGFRQANQGVPITKSTYENRVVETFILNPRWEADKAVADRDEFGAAAYIEDEAEAILEAAVQTMGRQFYYGTHTWTAPYVDYSGIIPGQATSGTVTYGGSGNGNPGLLDGYSTLYELDAGGTTANTASSVWGVKFGVKNISWVWGEAGQLTVSDVTLQRVLDSSNNPFTAYCQELLAYPGLQIGDNRSALRIKNITADTNHTLTDKLIFDAMALLPANFFPDMWLMSRRSLTQLRDSRTATNIIGAPAPIPTEVAGIPIMPTDSISNAEPINFLGL